jgi:hypothetical protein
MSKHDWFYDLIFSAMIYRSGRGVFHLTLRDKVCQWLASGWWFSPGSSVSSTIKTDRHDITKILLKVALCISPLTLWVRIPFRRGVLDTTLCHKVCLWLATCRWFSINITSCWLQSDMVCQWLASGWWFSPGSSVSSTIKTDRHDITKILLKVALTPYPLTWFKKVISVIVLSISDCSQQLKLYHMMLYRVHLIFEFVIGTDCIRSRISKCHKITITMTHCQSKIMLRVYSLATPQHLMCLVEAMT